MYAVVAVLVGMVVGLATGGRFRHVGDKVFRSVWLLVIGVGLQVGTEAFRLPHRPDQVLVLASYTALALFALRNLRLAGMGVVAIGLVLNIVPIAVNRGMPVRSSAIVKAGIASSPKQIAKLDFGGKRHLETGQDRLTWLGDILPDWVFHEVLSIGDLVMSVGIAAVFANLLKVPPRRRGRPGRRRRSHPLPPPEPPGPVGEVPSIPAVAEPLSALALAMATIEGGPTVGEAVALAALESARRRARHPSVRSMGVDGPGVSASVR